MYTSSELKKVKLCSRSVFFNLFAAMEPSANVCVAHGTLFSDPSVYPTFCNKPEG